MNLYRYDEKIGYTFFPDSKFRVPHESGAYLVKTDSRGFRNSEAFDINSDSILVFGDSFTAGDGVSNGHRWTDLIAKNVKEYKIVNFGLSGSGTDQQYMIWEKYAQNNSPRMVIISVLVENIRRNKAKYREVKTPEGEVKLKPKPYFEIEQGALKRYHQPVPRELIDSESAEKGSVDQGGKYPRLRQFIKKLGLEEQIQKITKYQPVPDYDNPNSKGWKVTRAILEEWITKLKAQNTPVLLLIMPLHQHTEEHASANGYQARFQELSMDLGVDLLDPLEYMQSFKMDERRRFRFERDVHLSVIGNKVMADYVGRKLKDALYER